MNKFKIVFFSLLILVIVGSLYFFKFQIKYYLYPLLDDLGILWGIEDSKKISFDKILNYKKYYAIYPISKKEKIEKIGRYNFEKYFTYKLPFQTYVESGQKSVAYVFSNYEKVFLVTGNGQLYEVKIDQNQKLLLQQLESNFDQILGYNFISSPGYYGVKGAYADENFLYLSYTKELKKNCFNTTLMQSPINSNNKMNFKELFTFNDCMHRSISLGHAAGGAISNYKTNHILFTVGDYMLTTYTDKVAAQSMNSNFGKVFSIEVNTGNAEIVSLGHRNPQGIYYDIYNDKSILVEHGPNGGDEINIIDHKLTLQNFGWPISSYGEFYSDRKKTKNASLFKNHQVYGFIEPIKYFTPSIGISSIHPIKNFERSYLVGAMGFNVEEGDQSIHLIEFNDAFTEIINHSIFQVNDRVRSITQFNGFYLMTLENDPRIVFFKIS